MSLIQSTYCDSRTIVTIHDQEPIQPINGIIHISDLHISDKNADKFTDVSDLFFNSLTTRTINPNNYIFAILGDIFDRKTTLTALEVHLFNKFITRLSSILPVIVIAGNHDCSLTPYKQPELIQGEPQNLITPVLLNKKTVYPVVFYPRTGIYFYRNLHITTLSVIEHHPGSTIATQDYNTLMRLSEDTPMPPYMPQPHRRIALFHEQVEGAQFEGLKFERCIPIKDMSTKFHSCLLGDQHEYTHLASNTAYSGAFMQQKSNESLNKGYLLWNIAAAVPSTEFVLLKSKYGSLRIKVKKGEPLPVTLDYRPEIITGAKIEYEDMSPQEISNTHDIICRYHNLPISTGYINLTPPDMRSLIKGDALDIFNISKFNEKIKEVLKKDLQYTDEVIQLHAAYTTKYADLLCPRDSDKKRYTIKQLHWSNYICYGKDNVIDFTQFDNKIAGIIADNGYGKTSTLHLLLLALFNYPNKDKKDLIGDPAKEATLQMVLSNGELHRVHNPKQANPNDSYKFNNKNLTSWTEIADHLGSLDAALRICIKTQEAASDFITDTSTPDRKQFLYKLFNLDAFEPLTDIIKPEINQISYTLVALNTELQHSMLAPRHPRVLPQDTLIIQLKKLEEYLIILQNGHTKAIKELDTFQQTKNKATSEYPHTNYSPIQHKEDKELLAKLTQQHQTLISKYTTTNLKQMINDEYNKLVHISTNKVLTTKTAEQLQNELTNLNAIIAQQSASTTPSIDINQLTKQIDILRQSIQKQKDSKKNIPETDLKLSKQKLEHILQLTDDCNFGSNCNVCDVRKHDIVNKNKQQIDILNITISKLQNEIAQINKSNILLDTQINESEEKLNELTDTYTNQVNIIRKQNEITNTKLHIKNVEEQLRSVTAEKNNQHIRDKIELYQKGMKVLTDLDTLGGKILLHEVEEQKYQQCKEQQIYIDKVNIGIQKTNEMINDYIVEIKILKPLIEDINKRIIRQTEIEQEISILSHKKLLLEKYEKCLDKSRGVPFQFLASIIIKLQEIINPILARLASFSIDIEIPSTDKTQMFISIIHSHNKKKIDVSRISGFQKFIVSLVFRVALFQLYTGPLPDILILDEGFGCLDKYNLPKVKDFLQEIKVYFKTIFIISHREEMQNAIEIPLTISRTPEGISRINGNTTITPPTIPVSLHRLPATNSTLLNNSSMSLTTVPIEKYIHFCELEKKFYCNICTPAPDYKYFTGNKLHSKSKRHTDKLSSLGEQHSVIKLDL